MRNHFKFLDFKYSLVIICMFGYLGPINAEEIAFKPKMSGFFLGEYIYSNYNQSLASGYRFGQKKSFDILCFPRAVVNLQSNKDNNAAVNLFMGFNFRSSCCYGNKNDPWSFTKFGVTDHAYLKLKNSSFSSEALLGVQYLPYGEYQNNVIPANFTQLLTQVQAGALTINTSWNDFTVSAFVFNGKKAPAQATTVNNFGLQLKYEVQNYKIKVGYLYNIANSVNYIISSSSSMQFANPLANTFLKRVDGIAINNSITFLDEYLFECAFTYALSKFNLQDLNWKISGAQPGALLAKFGRKFWLLGYQNNISVNYQYSWQALNVRGPNLLRGLPKQRYQLDWVVEPFKNLEVGAHYIVDLAYQSSLTPSNTIIFTMSYLFDLS